MTTKNEERQLVFLRRLVKTLGVILVFGAVFVFSVAVGRLGGKVKTSANIGKCNVPTQDIMLSQKGEVVAMSQNGDLLTLALKEDKGQKIVFIDLCTGKLNRTLRVN